MGCMRVGSWAGLLISMLLLTACGGGSSSGTPTKVPPTAVSLPAYPVIFAPALGSPLQTTDTLSVTFPWAVDTAGTTISPAGTWDATNTIYTFAGLTSGTVTVSIDAVSANGAHRITLDNILFNVYAAGGSPFIYVSTAGNDASGTGAAGAPYASIAKAMSVASPGQAVLVAGGTYKVDSGAGTGVIMVDGVSLYGGYSADFSSRDPAVHVTTLTDAATAAATALAATDYGTKDGTCGVSAAGLPRVPLFVGDMYSSVATIIDGFTMNGSASATTVDSAAVMVKNSGTATVVLSNNVLNGGSGSAMSVGVYGTHSANLVLTRNWVSGGAGQMSLGVYTGGGVLHADHNSMNGGTGAINAALFNDDLGSDIHPYVTGNTIVGGSGTNSYGIYNSPNCPAYTYPVVIGNAINGGSGSDTSTAYSQEDWVEADLYDNTIDGGSGATSKGIAVLDGANLFAKQNTVNGGSGTVSSTAIYMDAAYDLFVENSILFSTGTGTRVCFENVGGYNSSASNGFADFQNNDFSPSCSTALYRYNGTDTVSLADTVIFRSGESVVLTNLGNVSADPGFVSATDWHLTGASPAEVLQGGRNDIGESGANAVVPGVDKDNVVRTATITLAPANVNAAGLSMGAYEQD